MSNSASEWKAEQAAAAKAREDLRDRFAMAALPEAMRGAGYEVAAESAYEVADAMLAARAAPTPEASEVPPTTGDIACVQSDGLEAAAAVPAPTTPRPECSYCFNPATNEAKSPYYDDTFLACDTCSKLHTLEWRPIAPITPTPPVAPNEKPVPPRCQTCDDSGRIHSERGWVKCFRCPVADRNDPTPPEQGAPICGATITGSAPCVLSAGHSEMHDDGCCMWVVATPRAVEQTGAAERAWHACECIHCLNGKLSDCHLYAGAHQELKAPAQEATREGAPTDLDAGMRLANADLYPAKRSGAQLDQDAAGNEEAEPGAAERLLEEALRRAKSAQLVDLDDEMDALVTKLTPLREVLRLARLVAAGHGRGKDDMTWAQMGAALHALDEACK